MERLRACLSYLPRAKRAEAERLILRLTGPSSSLLEFCRAVDGARFLAPPHLRLLAERLREVQRYVETGGAAGIGRLIVNMPPRHGKTQTASKRWPAFLLGQHPEWRLALVAYQAELAADFSRANRELIETSAEYQGIFPSVRVDPSLSAADRWALAGGDLSHPSVTAVGVGGPLTGRGFQIIVLDDPIKSRAEAESQAYREHLWEFYKGTLRTRLEPAGAIVIICTRWHMDDLIGRLTDPRRPDADRWTTLNLKALAEGEDPLGRLPGEALWPERYPAAALAALRSETDDYEWESQYQQRPANPGGAVFRRDWFSETRFDAGNRELVAACAARWLSFDTALKAESDSAYSSCTVGELSPGYVLRVREVWRDKLEFHALMPEIARLARRYNQDGKLRGVVIEDKASGISALQTLRAQAEPWLAELLVAFTPAGDKSQRARQAAVWCRNGCVHLPAPGDSAPWLAPFELELFAFPNARYMDQVDSFGQLVIYLEHLLAEGYRARQGLNTQWTGETYVD